MQQQVLMTDSSREGLPSSISALGPDTTDLSLVCRDGVVSSHQAVLAWASATLRRWLMSNLLLEDGGKRKEEVTLFLPDCSSQAVSCLTSFLLTGQLDIRADRRLRDDFEEAWELLRIDRITFKAAFESGSLAKRTGGFKRPQDLPAITPFKAPPQPTPRKLGRPPQKTPSKAVGRGGPPGPPGPHTLGRGLIITPPLASSTPAPRPPTRIPHNLLNNANVSITREGGVGMEEDGIEIIEVSERRAGKLQISKRSSLTPSSSSLARRNMSLVYSSRQQRGGAVRSQLRPKMSQKHGVFKKSKIPRYPNKVKSALLKAAGEDPSVRKSLRATAVGASYNEEELERRGIKKSLVVDRRKYVKKTTTVIDDAQEEKIKEKMMSAQSPKLRIPIKKLVKTDTIRAASPKPPKAVSPSIQPTIQHTVSITKAPAGGVPLKNTISIKKPHTPHPRKGSASGAPPPPSTPETPKAAPKPAPILKLTPNPAPGIEFKPKPVLVTKTASKPAPSPKLTPKPKPSLKTALKPVPSPKVGPKPGPKPGVQSVFRTAGGQSPAVKTMSITRASETPPAVKTVSITRASEGPTAPLLPPTFQQAKAMTVSITRAGEGVGAPLGGVKVGAGGTRGAEAVEAVVAGDLTCYICHQSRDEEGRRLNHKNIFFVRSHLSKCLYNAGKLFNSIPPGRSNTNPEGGPIDELGNKTNSWYNCEVEGCWLAQKKGQAGQVCYKVYAIHMASQHGALEMVMLEEGEQARELVERLMNTEEDRRPGEAPVKQEPLVTVEEEVPQAQSARVTTLAALNALFPAPPPPSPAGVIFHAPAPPTGLAPPPQPVTISAPPPQPVTISAPPPQPVPISAPAPPRPSVLKITSLMHCRFPNCSQGPGSAGGNAREMKLHYAGKHFQQWFPVDPSTKLPPGFNRMGNRAVCTKCTATSGKPVYVQGEENAVRGHLVVKHDSLGEILLQAGEVPHSRDVIRDLYPELLEWTAGP